MTDWNGSAELGRDVELASAFEAIDPATYDPNYWFRFREWVSTNAAAELARRRLMARITVGDVMSSWARTLVPTAMLAAAIAGLLLIRSAAAADVTPIVLEELLVSEIPTESASALIARQGEAAVSFIAESF